MMQLKLPILVFACVTVSAVLQANDVEQSNDAQALPSAGWEELQIHKSLAAIDSLVQAPQNQNYDVLMMETNRLHSDEDNPERQRRSCAMVRRFDGIVWIRSTTWLLGGNEIVAPASEWIIDGDIVLRVQTAGGSSGVQFTYASKQQVHPDYLTLQSNVILPNYLAKVSSVMRGRQIRFRIRSNGTPEAGMNLDRLHTGPVNNSVTRNIVGGDILAQFSADKEQLPTLFARLEPFTNELTSEIRFYYEHIPAKPTFLKRVAMVEKLKDGDNGRTSLDARLERIDSDETSLPKLKISSTSTVWRTLGELDTFVEVSAKDVPQRCLDYVEIVSGNEVARHAETLYKELKTVRLRLETRGDVPLSELFESRSELTEPAPASTPETQTAKAGRSLTLGAAALTMLSGLVLLVLFFVARVGSAV